MYNVHVHVFTDNMITGCYGYQLNSLSPLNSAI